MTIVDVEPCSNCDDGWIGETLEDVCNVCDGDQVVPVRREDKAIPVDPVVEIKTNSVTQIAADVVGQSSADALRQMAAWCDNQPEEILVVHMSCDGVSLVAVIDRVDIEPRVDADFLVAEGARINGLPKHPPT